MESLALVKTVTTDTSLLVLSEENKSSENVKNRVNLNEKFDWKMPDGSYKHMRNKSEGRIMNKRLENTTENIPNSQIINPSH